MIAREILVIEEDGTERTFRTATECCKFYGFSTSALRNKLLGLAKKEKRIFKYGKTYSVEPHNKGVIKSEKPFNPDGYPEVPYETIMERICITVCQHKKDEGKDIKIGSALCKACSQHRGQSRERHLVACG